jgi:diaminohydroxyphosphoribosylaminopyrimidine deaminase/5-amino-6-(5-phosphoribosylamino)uracil reductase
MDSTLRLPLDSQLVKTAPDVPLWIVTAEPEDSRRIAEFEERGVKIIAITADLEKHPDLGVMSRKLGELGLTRVMLEGGPQLASAFLEEGLIDRIDWVTASIALGGDAVPAIATLQKALQPANGRFKSINTRQLGHDRLESFVRAGV